MTAQQEANVSAPGVWPARPDLRGWLGLLQQRGELCRLPAEVDPDQEVAAVLEELDGRSAVIFESVRGASFPLVGNTVATREDFSVLLGCPPQDVVRRLGAAISSPVSCEEVGLADAPVAAVHETGPDLLHDLPLPVQHEHDAGRYLTSALLTVRDARSGLTNLSINRLQATGPRELRALLLPGRLRSIFEASERRGEDLSIALCLGVDPALVLASQSPADRDIDDLEVASALHPRPLEVVRLPGHDTPVPARAEVVLVGTITAGERAPEGPFGEYPRTYGPGGPAPVIRLTGRWRRSDAMLQTILSGGREHFWVGGLPREARLLRALEAAGTKPYAARLTEAGSCRLHAVVALRDPAPGSANHAAMAVFAALAPVKLVVVVDEDIDVFDDEMVGWAVATRFQADRDLLVIPHTRSGGLDPSAEGGPTAKLVVDATVPAEKRQNHARMRSTTTGSARLSELMDHLEPAHA